MDEHFGKDYFDIKKNKIVKQYETKEQWLCKQEDGDLDPVVEMFGGIGGFKDWEKEDLSDESDVDTSEEEDLDLSDDEDYSDDEILAPDEQFFFNQVDDDDEVNYLFHQPHHDGACAAAENNKNQNKRRRTNSLEKDTVKGKEKEIDEEPEWHDNSGDEDQGWEFPLS
jgi:hypothetical protein